MRKYLKGVGIFFCVWSQKLRHWMLCVSFMFFIASLVQIDEFCVYPQKVQDWACALMRKYLICRYIPIFGTKFCPSLRFCKYKYNTRIKSTCSILSTLRMYTENSEKILRFSACTQNKFANVFSVHIQTH